LKKANYWRKSLNEHLEAINHAYAIDFIKELAQKNEPITEHNLLQIHSLILQGIDNANAGKYRTVQVMISGQNTYLLNLI
jgi:Fic family protein